MVRRVPVGAAAVCAAAGVFACGGNPGTQNLTPVAVPPTVTSVSAGDKPSPQAGPNQPEPLPLTEMSLGEAPRVRYRTSWPKEPQLRRLGYNIIPSRSTPGRGSAEELWQRLTTLENHGETAKFLLETTRLKPLLEYEDATEHMVQKYSGTAVQGSPVVFEPAPMPQYGQGTFIIPMQLSVMTFPQTAIGVGATWQVANVAKAGAPWNHVTAYELLGKINGRVLIHRRDCSWSTDPMVSWQKTHALDVVSSWQQADMLVAFEPESADVSTAGRSASALRYDLDAASELGVDEFWVSFDVHSNVLETPAFDVNGVVDELLAQTSLSPALMEALAGTRALYSLPALLERRRENAELAPVIDALVVRWFGVPLTVPELWLLSAAHYAEQREVEAGLQRFAKLPTQLFAKDEQVAIAVGRALLLETAKRNTEAREVLLTAADSGELFARQALVWWLATRGEVSRREQLELKRVAEQLLAANREILTLRVAAAAYTANGQIRAATALLDQALLGVGELPGYRAEEESVRLNWERTRYTELLSEKRANPKAKVGLDDERATAKPTGLVGRSLRDLVPKVRHQPSSALAEDSWCRRRAVPKTAWANECLPVVDGKHPFADESRSGAVARVEDLEVWCPFENATTTELVASSSPAQRSWWLGQRAPILMLQGKPQAAIQALNEVVQRYPSANGLNNLAWVLATAGNSKLRDGVRAITLAQQALRMRPTSTATMDTLAAAYAEAGQFEEAITWQERVLSGGGAVPRGVRRPAATFEALLG